MKREKDLLKNSIILMIGNTFPKLISIITLPLLTLKLSTKEYGIYDFILTIVSLLLPAVTVQIQSAAFRFLIDNRNDKTEEKRIISNVIFFTLLTSTISLVILFLLLFNIRFDIRICMVLYLFVDILQVTYGQILRGLGKNKEYSISSIINSSILVILMLANLLWLNSGLIGVLISLLVSSTISIIYLIKVIDIKNLFSTKFVNKQYILKLLKYSWPMVPNNLSSWILALSDRLVITFFLGIEANAVYAVANKIPNFTKIFQSTFMSAWQENAAVNVNDNDVNEYYSKMFDKIFSLLISVTVVLIAFTPLLFYILIKGNYSSAFYQIPILFIGVFFSCIASFLGGIYIAHKKTRSVGVTTFVAAICNLIIDLLLVTRIGIYAGSISTVLSYLILILYRIYDIKKFQPIKIRYKKIILCLIMLLSFSILIYIRNIYVVCAEMIISIIVSYILNKEIVLLTLNKCIKILEKRLK